MAALSELLRLVSQLSCDPSLSFVSLVAVMESFPHSELLNIQVVRQDYLQEVACSQYRPFLPHWLAEAQQVLQIVQRPCDLQLSVCFCSFWDPFYHISSDSTCEFDTEAASTVILA